MSSSSSYNNNNNNRYNRYNNNNNNYNNRNSNYNKRRRYNNNNNNRYNKKYRVDNIKPDEIIRSKIVRIGDNKPGDRIKLQLDDLSNRIMENMKDYSIIMSRTIIDCATCLSDKMQIYVTLLGIMNTKHREFVVTCLNKCKIDLIQYFNDNNYDKFRTLFRFVISLCRVNILSINKCAKLIYILTEKIDEIDVINYQDWIVFTILLLLPDVGEILATNNDFQTIWRKLELYMENRNSLLQQQQNNNNNVFKEHCEYESSTLNELWISIRHLREKTWQCQLNNNNLYQHFQNIWKSCETHNFPTIELNIENLLKLPAPIIRSHLKLRKINDENKIQDIDEMIARQYIIDCFTNFNQSTKIAAKHVMDLNIPFNYDAIIFDVMFSKMLSLSHPISNLKISFYAFVTVELAKLDATKFGPIIGYAIYIMWKQAHILHIDIIDRLVIWFSLYLNNFKFKFAWPAWKSILEQDDDHPQRRFVCQLLEKCVQLSYWECVKKVLPTDFIKLMPPHPIPAFRFKKLNDDNNNNDNNNNNNNNNEEIRIKHSESLQELITNGADSNTILLWMENNISKTSGHHAALNIFIPTLLHLGEKSVSHVRQQLLNYRHIFLKLAPSPLPTNLDDITYLDAQIEIVKSVAEFWQHSHLHTRVILEFMVTFKLVTPDAIFQWLFNHMNDSRWEIIDNIVRRILRAIDSTRQKSENETDEIRREKIREFLMNAEIRLFVSVFKHFDNYGDESRWMQFIRIHGNKLRNLLTDKNNNMLNEMENVWTANFYTQVKQIIQCHNECC